MVSVAIPVLNGARYLDEVLGAVRGQELPAGEELEIVVVDSGSGDRSREIAARHGARVHEIARADFSHGGTRNLLMELSSGEHVAFLTQDATPASPQWLGALLAGFGEAERVGAVFGPHRVRPGASHMIAAEMERHFRQWEDPAVRVQRLERSPGGLAAYRAAPGRWSFLSSVNMCLARAAWRQVPFRAIPYAEDQLLGRELVEAGWAKVYAPDAAVLHSHDYRPWAFFRRYFDEWRSLREVLGHVQPAGPYRSYRDVRGLVGADRRWLRAQGLSGGALVKPLAASGRHHAARVVAAGIGSRSDRLPTPVRRMLSLEGRDTFEPVAAPSSPLLSSPGVEVDGEWGWDFVRRGHPLREVGTEPHAPVEGGPMTLAWVVPSWKVGSGGHTTIFRLIAQMEARGHPCAIHVFDPLRRDKRPAAALRREISERFVPVAAPVFRGLGALGECDVAVATNWWTAWPLRDVPGPREKAYLVQDFEPDFEPNSARRIWAEDTYRMGYRTIAYTEWMAGELRARYGTDARWFDCGTDLDVYRYAGPDEREPGLVAVYARQETERRAVELALASIATLVEQRPGTRIALFGTSRRVSSPVPAESLGVLAPAELAALYRRASAGLVFSLTTHSLVSQEMMASGLPVVELDGPNVTMELGASGERALLVPPRPDAVADALARVLDDSSLAAELAGRARTWVEGRTWKRAGDQVESALRSFLATPMHPLKD